VGVDLVIPTTGRPTLGELLSGLAAQAERLTGGLIVVDDRRRAKGPLPSAPAGLEGRLRVIRGRACGPAAARNSGWRRSSAEWVAFLDDDVLPEPHWVERLERDLAAAGPDVAAVQGRLMVPLPGARRPTDWERNTAGLERARWATADMAYRRADLLAVGGFDERFPRAYREDADLALRTVRRGRRIVCGERRVMHPPRPASWWTSVRLQRGNADDVLMRSLHGKHWREAAGAPLGRLPRHAAASAAAASALGAAAHGRRGAAAISALGWAALTAELAWARIRPGPRTPAEVARMVTTSLAMPFAATAWHLVGRARWRRPPRPWALPAAVLLDRDGTLIADRPYNGDPSRVVPMPGALAALERLRAAGVRLAVVSNQSGVGRELISPEQVEAVNRRTEDLLGPLGPWLICAHAPDAGCRCRKPAPGLVMEAAARLGVPVESCVMVGDIGADVEAALAAGAGAVLVPTPLTRPEELRSAPAVARDLPGAVDLMLGGAS
jgi:histidinol-phosphate phosphatase family protein